ncbi:MAG: DNA mismatch repair endonuclease MutL [Lachnospiraceae bacterium]|nr:DNA mismatch repair endonuclease MutL [Lachnospiraceae bacterium]
MARIQVLDKNTIDKIAAGEVIERPSSVVKELVENAVDAGASSITVEIKDGGISLIRIADNGSGIEADQVAEAFLRHSTSKIRRVEDLSHISSLGFRGEALSSIAAVAQVELITKTADAVSGTCYRIEGGMEKGMEEIGAPDGTTFLVRNLFFNVPARRKFLKTPMTEAGYISSLMERIALSHPEISFKFIVNHQTRLQTSGNTNLKDIIYNVYGREVARELLLVRQEQPGQKIGGYIGKPVISRGNRNYENYFVNGRYVKSNVISRAIEDAYKPFMMQHRYPFTALDITVDGELVDINVHPTKMEVRFSDAARIYQFVYQTLYDSLSGRELIPEISLDVKEKPAPSRLRETSVYSSPKTEAAPPKEIPISEPPKALQQKDLSYFMEKMRERVTREFQKEQAPKLSKAPVQPEGEQLDLFEHRFLDKRSRANYRIVGQVFDTYWLVQFEDKLYIIDQHAAHEKVLYERTMKALKDRDYTSQLVSPPIILTLSMQEEEQLLTYMDNFTALGFEIEPFGGREYAVRAVPANLFSIAQKEVLLEMLDSLNGFSGHADAEIINEKIASMSCKAAVKGNNHLSGKEAEALIDELLNLDNPYNCPHGRPTIVSMSQNELEKKFKRIV